MMPKEISTGIPGRIRRAAFAMMSFLFWNLYGRQERRRQQRLDALKTALGRLAHGLEIDVFLFSESGIPDQEILSALNQGNRGDYYAPDSRSKRIRFFSRLPGRPWRDAYNDGVHHRMTAQKLGIGGGSGILLVGIHFPDRTSLPTPEGRLAEAEDIAISIRRLEDDVQHQRTVVAGDFNMNPFEPAVVAAKGFHGLMTRTLAKSVNHRLSKRAEFPCFYNPMWHLFGDVSPGPSGTYFFGNTADTTNHFWNVYDQVLVRPALMERLTNLRILDSDGQESLVTKEGRPRKDTFSDPLPIFFRLDL